MARALVTGAGGFIGANLVLELAARGHEVHALVRSGSGSWRLDGAPATMHELDLRDAAAVDALVASLQPEWACHLPAHGAYSWEKEPLPILETNVTGTAALLEALART